MKTCTGYDIALTNLAKDVGNTNVTIDQVIHTAECIAMAYGPIAELVLHEAIAEAKLRRWTPPVRFH